MSRTYIKAQGDMWDGIAHTQLGDVAYTDKLISLNPAYRDFYIFPAGIALTLPEPAADVSPNLPPWKQVSGQ